MATSGSADDPQLQDEFAAAILRSVMPDLVETINRVTEPYNEVLVHNLGNGLQPLVEGLDRLPKIEVPALPLDYGTLFPDLADLNKTIAKSVLPGIEALHSLQREQFAGLLKGVRAALDSMLPPNWRSDAVQFPHDLEVLLLDEGLPLAWVPPQDVLAKVFASETAAARRRVFGSHWKSVTTACLSELEGIQDAGLHEYVEFAVDAAKALRDGQSKASQALSANLLDTILRRSFSKDSHRALTDQDSRPSIDDYPVRVAIVIGGIWGSHSEYRPWRRDAIPHRYSRHASAHGVSRRQYSRVNAIMALMHVVGLLKVMEVDLK